MKLRDSYARINRDDMVHEIGGSGRDSNGVDIIGDDNRTLFSLRLNDDGSLEVSAGDFCKHDGGPVLDTTITVSPKNSSRIVVRRDVYEEGKS